MLKFLIQPVTPFQQNAPILYCEESKKCAFVDPGGDIDILLGIAKDNHLIPEKIFLTHGHIDHAGAATELARILALEIGTGQFKQVNKILSNNKFKIKKIIKDYKNNIRCIFSTLL